MTLLWNTRVAIYISNLIIKKTRNYVWKCKSIRICMRLEKFRITFRPPKDGFWTIAVLFRAHMHRSMIRPLCTCYTQRLMHRNRNFSAFPCITWYQPLFKHILDYVVSKVNKFGYGHIMTQYLIEACHTNAQMSQSQGMSHDDLIPSVHAHHR